MVRIANAPCSWGVIEGIEGDRAGWVRVRRRDAGDRLRRHRARRLGLHAHGPRRAPRRARPARPGAHGLVGQRQPRGPRPSTSVAPTTPCARAGSSPRSAAPRRSSSWATTRTATRTATRIAGRVTPEDGMTRRRVEGLRRGRQPRRPPGHGRGRDPDGRPPAHRHAHRDRGRGPAPVRDDRPVRRSACASTPATGPSGPAATRSRPSASSATASGTSTSRTATRPSWPRRARRRGTAPSPSATASSASSARAASTSRACSRRSTTSATTGWIVVEQDVLPGMGNPRESARRNREYLRSIGV